jgi:ribonuclease I
MHIFVLAALQVHEWEKHGTCAEELFPREADFFNATLRLNAAANLEVPDLSPIRRVLMLS